MFHDIGTFYQFYETFFFASPEWAKKAGMFVPEKSS